MRDLIAEMGGRSSFSTGGGGRDLIAEMGGVMPTVRPEPVEMPSDASIYWNEQLKPSLMDAGKEIFEIPKSLGEVGLSAISGVGGWLVGSGLAIAESLKPGSTRESVRATAEDAAGRLAFQPRTRPAQDLMERTGRLVEAVTGPAGEAAALVGESWDSPFLEAVTKFAGELATFEAAGKVGKVRPKAPEWYRRMTVKERGLVEGIKADIASGEYTGAELRELWKDPVNREVLLKKYQGVETEGQILRQPETPRDLMAEIKPEAPKKIVTRAERDLVDEMALVEEFEVAPQGEGYTIAKKKSPKEGPEGIIGRIVEMGGLNIYDDYNAPEMRQFPDMARVMRKAGAKPDEMAANLESEGYRIGSGDDLIEMLKTGQVRDVLTPGKAESIIERKLRGPEHEWIERQLEGLTEQARIDAGSGENKGYIEKVSLDEIATETGLTEQELIAAQKDVADFFDAVSKPTTEATADLPGISARETFSLVNPETEIGVLQSKKNMTPTADVFADVTPEMAASEMRGKAGIPSKEERTAEIKRLKEENRAILATPLASEGSISPVQIGRFSEKQRKKWQDNAQKRMRIESRIRDLEKSDEQLQKEQVTREQKKISDRLIQVESQIKTLDGLGIMTHLKNGEIKTKYKPQYEALKKERESLIASERGSTGPVGESEILNAILKTRGKIEDAMPHIEALGRSVFDSGKQRFLDWQASMKSRLGELWESFKAHLKGVWDRIQSGKIGPLKSDRGSFSTKPARDEVKSILSDIKQTADEYMGAISTRLGNIDPSLKYTLRKFEMRRGIKAADTTERVLPFLKKVGTMSTADKAAFDLARKNGDGPVLKEMVIKYGMGKEYHELRNVLAEMHKDFIEVGGEAGFRSNFHPRVLKDPKGFLEYFYKQKDWPVLEKAIRAKETELQRYLSGDEKAKLINTMLRGYPSGHISLSRPGQMKAREIEMVTPEINQFYMDSDGALLRYISDVTDSIEARRLFGKGRYETSTVNITDAKGNLIHKKSGPNKGQLKTRKHREYRSPVALEDTIGGYVLDLLQKGKIKPEQERVLKDILDARFNEVGTRGIFGLYKNLALIDTMGSPISAVTQIGDLAWAFYKNGLWEAGKATARSVVGKSAFKKEDLGIQGIASEFADTSKLARAVDKTFRLIGLTKIDNIGKEALINSTHRVARSKAMTDRGTAALRKELEPIFEGETDALIKDLRTGDITENVKLYLFNTLTDFQPVALSEMPQKYLTGGNGRIFYTLKTFTLKQFDAFRREAFQKIAKGGTRLEGIKNLVWLSAVFVVSNAAADAIKDLIMGRPIVLDDLVMDNILRLAGTSKFFTWKARVGGIGEAVILQVAPPVKAPNAIYKDIMSAGDEKGLEITQSIPLVGKLYYWWFGKGAEKSERRRQKSDGGGRLVKPNLKGLSGGKLKGLR